MSDPRCDWCREPESEHDGLGVGCDGFIPIDYRAKAHAVLDVMMDRALLGEEPTALLPALRMAIRRHTESLRETGP